MTDWPRLGLLAGTFYEKFQSPSYNNGTRPCNCHHTVHPCPRHLPSCREAGTPEWKRRNVLQATLPTEAPQGASRRHPPAARGNPRFPGPHVRSPAAGTHLDWVCFVILRMVAPSLPMMAPTYWVGTRSRSGMSTCCCLAGAPAATGEPWRG